MKSERDLIEYRPAQVVAFKKIKGPALMGALKHNLREIVSTAHEHRHAIDSSKSRLNVILRGARTSAEAKVLHEQLKEKNAIKNLRRDHVAAVEVVVSAPASYIKPQKYFEAAVAFFERFWAPTNFIGRGTFRPASSARAYSRYALLKRAMHWFEPGRLPNTNRSTRAIFSYRGGKTFWLCVKPSIDSSRTACHFKRNNRTTSPESRTGIVKSFGPCPSTNTVRER